MDLLKFLLGVALTAVGIIAAGISLCVFSALLLGVISLVIEAIRKRL